MKSLLHRYLLWIYGINIANSYITILKPIENIYYFKLLCKPPLPAIGKIETNRAW